MMQVEEKPDVTYSDVGGCKEQIEKLREVVETPLLHVSTILLCSIQPPHQDKFGIEGPLMQKLVLCIHNILSTSV